MRLFFFFASSCSSVHAQLNNPQPLGPFLSLFTLVPSSWVSKKNLSQDDNVAYVWIERPCWKLCGLAPRLVELLCARAMIYFSKAHDQSFLAWYDFPNVWKTVCSSEFPKGWKRRLRTKILSEWSLDSTNYTASLRNDKLYLLKIFKQEATFMISAAYSQLVFHLKEFKWSKSFFFCSMIDSLWEWPQGN